MCSTQNVMTSSAMHPMKNVSLIFGKTAKWGTFKMLLIQGLGHCDKDHVLHISLGFTIIPGMWNALVITLGDLGSNII